MQYRTVYPVSLIRGSCLPAATGAPRPPSGRGVLSIPEARARFAAASHDDAALTEAAVTLRFSPRHEDSTLARDWLNRPGGVQ